MSWRGLRACPSFEGAIRRQLTNGIKLDVAAAPLERVMDLVGLRDGT
jgi:hypothetical protein